jgi:hypothetical protein
MRLFFLSIFTSILFNSSAQLINENFNSIQSGTLPNGWTEDSPGSCYYSPWAVDYSPDGLNTIDGSKNAFSESDICGPGGGAEEILYSHSVDASGATSLFLEFDQILNIGGPGSPGLDTCSIEIFDGLNWVEIYMNGNLTGSNLNPNHQILEITSYANSNLQFRFTYNDNDSHEGAWIIDNIVVDTEPSNLSTDEVAKKILKIYPNPVSDKLNISWLNLISGIEEITITAVSGETVIKANNISDAIDVSTLNNGVYFCNIRHIDGIETIKFIKK